MSFECADLLQTTPNIINLCKIDTSLVNTNTNFFDSGTPHTRAEFLSAINAYPLALDVGAWGKAHGYGASEYFTLKSGYRLLLRRANTGTTVNISLLDTTGNYYGGVNGLGVGFASDVNTAGILVLFIDKANEIACLSLLRDVRDRTSSSWTGNIRPAKTSGTFSNAEMQQQYIAFASSLPPEFPWKEEGTTTGGGQGVWGDDSSDEINPPSATDLNENQLTDTFFATTYRLSKEELRALGGVMWTPSVVESLKSLFGNPLESIINLYMLPFDSYKGNKVQIVLGTYHTGIVGYLTEQYKEINCGVLEIPEKWAGALDYESRVQIYLPFIGTKELDTAEVMGGQIGVKYLIDILTGACVAYVSVKKGNLESVLYQFTGNCSYSFPLTQANYNSFYSALLSATATVASGVVTGGASVPMMVGAGASVAMGAKTHVAHSGNLAGNTGYMGIKKPYVILTRPIQALPKDFGKYRGYQSHITKKLGDCSGYTQVEYIHLDGIDRATSEELTEIENLLKGGVIIA